MTTDNREFIEYNLIVAQMHCQIGSRSDQIIQVRHSKTRLICNVSYSVYSSSEPSCKTTVCFTFLVVFLPTAAAWFIGHPGKLDVIIETRITQSQSEKLENEGECKQELHRRTPSEEIGVVYFIEIYRFGQDKRTTGKAELARHISDYFNVEDTKRFVPFCATSFRTNRTYAKGNVMLLHGQVTKSSPTR